MGPQYTAFCANDLEWMKRVGIVGMQLPNDSVAGIPVNYTDVDPDALNAVAHGIRGHYLKPGQTAPAPNEWGAIAAWAWGVSRVVDYLETDAAVDAQRIAIMGISRLGKTVFWAGAADPRIALVIASCSGEGGAALSRRNYGETIAHLTRPTRYPYHSDSGSGGVSTVRQGLSMSSGKRSYS